MPKAMQYTKGAVVYFEGDHDDRIYILQQGTLVLTSTDIETGAQVVEQVKPGEFFGVKSALGHFPREESATALTESMAVCLTVKEFEILFSQNKQLIMKMLRVFSNQLRQIHKKIESILNNVVEDQQSGMLAVAKSFYDEEQFRSAADVYTKFIQRFPESPRKGEVAPILKECLLRAQKQAARGNAYVSSSEPAGEASSLQIFSLPAFARFAKTYEPGQVIISEFEPGDSFYLIKSGNVQLVKCVNGAKKNLDILKPGEFFGEMAILDSSPRSATCLADGKVECLEFNKANFEVLITGNPQIALILLKLFCKRIYDQKRRFKILVIKDISARVVNVLLMLDEMSPGKPNERQRRLNVTVGDVAHWAGLPLDTTNAELHKLVERRKIEIYDTYVVVNNINDLKRVYGKIDEK